GHRGWKPIGLDHRGRRRASHCRTHRRQARIPLCEFRLLQLRQSTAQERHRFQPADRARGPEPRLCWPVRPLAPISTTARIALGILFFVLFFAAWGYVTFGGYVSKTFLADPLTMVQEGWLLLTKHGFLFDIAITIWRVVGGFVLAALIAVPLGILMGAYKPIEAFLEPFVSFARYLPASAFIPLLILWAGIGEMQKLLVIFIGSFFQLVLMVAVAVAGVRRDLVEAALTLGARDRGILARVLIPAAA